jgi:hypothetical protein
MASTIVFATGTQRAARVAPRVAQKKKPARVAPAFSGQMKPMSS